MRVNNGNCNLLGLSGNGRKSLARLGIYLSGIKLFEICPEKNYNMK